MGTPVQASDRPARGAARLRLPWLRARPSPGTRPDRRSRRAPRGRRRTLRHRQLRRALPLLQLDEGCGRWRPGVPTRGFCAPGRPRLPIVRTRPGFARNPGPRWPTGATVGPRGAMRNAMATRATERERALGWRPGPESRLVAVGLSGVALGSPPPARPPCAARGPRPDRLGRRRPRLLGLPPADGLGRATANGSGSIGATSAGATASAALRARASLRSALVYWFQWGLHIRPRPSLWLGWAGKSPTGASCASIPNFADPMHFLMSAMSFDLSLADADLAFGDPSITRLARRCKVEDRQSPDDDQDARRGDPRLAQPDHRLRRGGA